jgi:hypothetical protein
MHFLKWSSQALQSGAAESTTATGGEVEVREATLVVPFVTVAKAGEARKAGRVATRRAESFIVVAIAKVVTKTVLKREWYGCAL